MERFDLLKVTLDEVYEELTSVLAAKNADYAGGLEDLDEFANFQLAKLFLGLAVEQAIYVRFLDKVARIASLMRGRERKVVDERLDDTILDAIGYLVILKAWFKKMELEQQDE